jgi:riboflavin-specific deaminase-like protein
MSVDGYVDGTGPSRLVLSGEEDLDRVDAERAGCDAILVGAGTLRRDDPGLLVRSPARREERRARGLPPSPARVTLTAGGDLDPSLRFFTSGDTARLVYCSAPVAAALRERLGGSATVVDAGDPLDLRLLLRDLAGRGIRRLMVEGGGTVHTQLLTAGLADELQLVVAPFFVGDAAAPRFVGPGRFPHDARSRMRLAEVRRVGDVVLLRYLLSAAGPAVEPAPADRDRRWLQAAIDLSRRCPPSTTAYSVGAVIVGEGGEVIAEGFSREADPTVHAEESALAKAGAADGRLAGATIYSSMEPCSVRRSRPRACADLIVAAGIRHVVFALREPELFVDGRGAEKLAAAGVTVVEVADMGDQVREVNAHLLA